MKWSFVVQLVASLLLAMALVAITPAQNHFAAPSSVAAIVATDGTPSLPAIATPSPQQVFLPEIIRQSSSPQQVFLPEIIRQPPSPPETPTQPEPPAVTPA